MWPKHILKSPNMLDTFSISLYSSNKLSLLFKPKADPQLQCVLWCCWFGGEGDEFCEVSGIKGTCPCHVNNPTELLLSPLIYKLIKRPSASQFWAQYPKKGYSTRKCQENLMSECFLLCVIFNDQLLLSSD